ncbi:MAG: thiamine pyrophosphate-dependent dehydrogenase E1 component subunit alpha, partial [Rubrobacter sp.]
LYVGEEAVAVGACAALEKEDRITSTHRGHGHVIAKGAEVDRMMAELLGRQDGYCRGKGGSMHIVDFGLGIMGTNSIVGAGIPIAVGSALGDKQLGRDWVTVSFFGDGAANQGVFMEGMNLASIWKLPVVFLCENNGYTEWTPTEKLTAGEIADRGKAMNIPCRQVDGNDVRAVHDAVAEAVERGRAGEGPSLVEAKTYRFHGHNEGEEAFSGRYRTDEEISGWRGKDPIGIFKARLVDEGVANEEDITRIDAEETERVEEAVAFAEASPFPEPEEALEHVFYKERPEIQEEVLHER